jgi:hypothetical protein
MILSCPRCGSSHIGKYDESFNFKYDSDGKLHTTATKRMKCYHCSEAVTARYFSQTEKRNFIELHIYKNLTTTLPRWTFLVEFQVSKIIQEEEASEI